MGLVSGTRRLREELLDEGERLARIPVALAEYRVAHAAPRIDEEGHRQPSHAPLPRRFLLRIEEHRKRHLLLAEELRDLVARLAIVHGEHVEGSGVELLAQALQRGHL